nr:unnamed protein product [Callosobruchus chinensis]
MNQMQFNNLLEKVTPTLSKTNTLMHMWTKRRLMYRMVMVRVDQVVSVQVRQLAGCIRGHEMHGEGLQQVFITFGHILRNIRHIGRNDSGIIAECHSGHVKLSLVELWKIHLGESALLLWGLKKSKY